ncbi:MAG: signal recognition particle subunit SRP19/SEC65 family protein [Candidatus Thorarchaeota archaeon]|nr:MAG: signal recognition particle protein Srp19 [Candidatus Thorarchaeota archaeon]RLI60192.1 MAG: signal recognition particle protein Srp19 [Candidatus Thorarchaeota archaeon]
MRKRDGMLIFWPAYFEKRYTRSQGRRLPTNLAAENVNIQVLEAAAKAAGLGYEVEADKRYPRSWLEKQGYIVVENSAGHKKKRVMLQLAKAVRRDVAQRESARLAAEKKKKGKKRRKRR